MLVDLYLVALRCRYPRFVSQWGFRKLMLGIADNPDMYIPFIVFTLAGSKSIPYSHMLIRMLLRSDPRLINTNTAVKTYLSSGEGQSGWWKDMTITERLQQMVSCLSLCGSARSIEFRVGAICPDLERKPPA